MSSYNGRMTRGFPALCLAAFLLPLAAQRPASPAPASSAQAPAAAQFQVPRLTYSKSFRGSVPSFLQITVRQDGVARFESVEKPGDPPATFDFTASKLLVSRVFALTRALHDLAKPVLESKSKVGYMGTKMLAYDDDGHHAQQTFNFTSVPAASELTDIFERIAASGEHAARLRHAVRYDHLGVVQELDGITQDWSEHQLLAPELLRPLLEQVANDPALMEIAHRRAHDLLAEMRDATRIR